MENAVSTFPILHLPFSVQQQVLRKCKYMEQLMFSVLSERTKSIVRSLKIKTSVSLWFKNPIELSIDYPTNYELSVDFDYGKGNNGELKSVEGAPERVIFVVFDFSQMNGRQRTTIRSQLTFREWFLHILHVYHGSHIRSLYFCNESRVYDILSIATALQRVETPILFIRGMNDDQLFRRITTCMLPTEKIWIDHRPEDANYFQKVLLSNFDFMEVNAHQLSYFGSLDTLLSIIAANLVISYSSITDKTMNQFLKLWVKGVMPRLKRLLMYFNPNDRVLRKHAIVNGINYNENGQDYQRSGVFEWHYRQERLTVNGGFNIKNRNGVQATTQLTARDDNVTSFDFYVWSE